MIILVYRNTYTGVFLNLRPNEDSLVSANDKRSGSNSTIARTGGRVPEANIQYHALQHRLYMSVA